MASAMLPSGAHTLVACGQDVIAFGGLTDPSSAVSDTSVRTAGSIRPKTAPIQRPMTAGGLRATAALHAFSSESGQWRTLTPVAPGGKGPTPRSGHAACTLSTTSMLVLGGAGARHEKLADCWRLDLADQKKKESAYLELTLDVITAAEAAAAAAAAAEAAATGEAAADINDGGAAPPPPKEVLQLEKLVASLSGAVGGLPAECFRAVEAASSSAAGEPPPDSEASAGITVRVDVRPIVGVGFNTFQGKDGELLPLATMAALEAKLQRVCPQSQDGDAAAADAKGKDAKGKDAKGKPPAKGKGAKDAGNDDAELAAARAAAAKAAAHRRVVGYPLLGWKVHRQTSVIDVPTVKWVGAPIAPAPTTEATAALALASGCEDTGCMTPRAGHSAVRSFARARARERERERERAGAIPRGA